jgi:hypothetical protein
MVPGPQAPLQLAPPQSQRHSSRFGTCVDGHASVAASQTQLHDVASKTKPGPQLPVCAHSHAHTDGSLLQVVKPPQEALQSGAHSAVHVVVSHCCVALSVPPQSAGHW